MKFQPRKCLECGREFIPKSGTQKYCIGPHFTTCRICGKKIEYICSPKEKPSYCSQICRNRGHENTVMTRYGVKNVSKLQNVRDKIAEKNSSEDVRNKTIATCRTRYGVDNVSQSKAVRAKLSEVMSSDEYLNRRAETCLSKYGANSPMQSDSVKKKRAQTCLDRYGCEGHSNSREFYEKRLIDGSKVDNFMSFRSDPENFISSNYKEKPTISTLEKDLGCTNTPIYDILIRNDCRDAIAHSTSLIEDEVYEFIKQYIDEYEIIRRDREVIKPREIDIYIPSLRFGIECNPAATHNSTIGAFDDKPISNNYHFMKSRMCEEHSIQLFHIFGYEWKHRQDVVKSMLRYNLNFVDRKIGARQCNVEEIPFLECQTFLNENHLQGSMNGSTRLGLRVQHTDELVSVMIFNKLRPTIGISSKCDDNTFELARFCSKINTSVVGGANKLFQYFVQSYQPNKIVSFSDVAHTSGRLYNTLGFNKVNQSSPSYHWSDMYDDVWLNRVNCQKRFLRKLLCDESIDIENQTERQIMEQHKFVQVFDCGTIRWEWIPENR